MKRERVYRELLFRSIEMGEHRFVQRRLAATCEVSIGLVNSAIGPLKRMGAVSMSGRSFELLDPWKTLHYWCSVRDLEKEIVYSTRVDSPVTSIEASLPRDAVPTSYTAYRERYDEAPADYSEVYAYGDAESFERRFGPSLSRAHNLFVLRTDPHLAAMGSAPVAQVYVDLWNTSSWYARRFLEALGKRIRDMIPGGIP